MIVFVDVMSGSGVSSDAYEIKELADGGVMAIQSEQIQVGDVKVDTGANAAKGDNPDAEKPEEADSEVKDDVEQVINLVHAHKLQVIKLDKKDYKTLQKQYFKDLMKSVKNQMNKLLFDETDHSFDSDPDEAKKETEDALTKLSKAKKAKYDALKDMGKTFKGRQKALEKFVKNEVLENFKEFDFYTPENSNLGNCMIIPARWIGDAKAPVFYFFRDGMTDQKQ